MAEILDVSAAYSGNMASAAEGTNHDFTYTVPADTTYLLGHVGFTADRTVSGFTVGGNSMDSLVAKLSQSPSFQHLHDDETSPPTGTDLAVEIDMSSDTGSFNRSLMAALVAIKDLDASPVRSTNSASGTANTMAVTVTTVAGDLVVATLHRVRADAVTTSDTPDPVTEHLNAASAIGESSFESRIVIASQIATGTSTTITFTGSNSRDWTLSAVALIPAATGPDPATISREPADIPLARQTDTTAHVRIDTVDTTTGNTHKLWGHTSNLGADDPDAWEASATEVDASVTTNDLVAWASRTPNTAYYFAVVSTDSGSNKTQSAVLTITTAYAKPTSPTIVSKTSTSVTVSATDASSGAADHQAFFRESAQALSALQFAGTIPAGETIQCEFTDLTAGTEYSFEFVAWDGVETEATARYSGLTAITATPTSIPIFAYHYRQMAVA